MHPRVEAVIVGRNLKLGHVNRRGSRFLSFGINWLRVAAPRRWTVSGRWIRRNLLVVPIVREDPTWPGPARVGGKRAEPGVLVIPAHADPQAGGIPAVPGFGVNGV